ncbi:hypothetical protein K461DRAFT_292690 [Myriangium duriaei CBS 260.36]|uniref:Uncharacterized protein n=1 Tax=Myriangium duriaei CBS 260.36 TaxID=1168546 RepID=A0A9P4MGU1_9PEZI|nr:hypothetical protein K461DRAFT_292690 [Myriangium duriaei CBS 260.36]
MDIAAGHATRQRPKLSLNTSGISDTFSYKSSSLRLDTLSVISPTSRNTFQNIYNSTLAKSPQRASQCSPLEQSSYHESRTATPKDSALSPPKAKFTPPRSQVGSDPADHLSRTEKPIVSVNPPPENHPPRPTPVSQRPTTSTILRPIISTSCERSSSRRRKSVTFRAHLTETIQTNTYVLAHSDLLGLPDSEDATPMLPSPSFPLPQRSKSRPIPNSRILGRRENKNESRWKAAIEAAEADESDDCLNQPSKRGSPTEISHDGSDPEDCASNSDSKRRRRASQTPRDAAIDVDVTAMS